MCGIAGWYCEGAARPTPEVLRGLLLANMERGLSATGMAWEQDDQLMVLKNKGPAKEFIEANSDAFNVAAKSPRGLLHARATTKGSEANNDNNHPVVGFGYAVVHNGTISNDDDLWAYYTEKQQVTRIAEVDTSAIPLVLSRHTELEQTVQSLSVLGGSLTIAAWNSKDLNRIILARFGHNDLFLFLDTRKRILYWTSATSAAFLMAGPTYGGHKFITYSKLADAHVMVLQPEGLDKTRTFKVTRSPFFGPPKRHSKTSGVSEATRIVTPQRIVTSIAPTAHVPSGRQVVTFRGEGHEPTQKVVWAASDDITGKPTPLTDAFTPVWWSRNSAERWALTSTKRLPELASGYGRWLLGPHFETWTFQPYKRTKQWWERQYRTKIRLSPGVSYTDAPWSNALYWEYYAIQTIDPDGVISAELGWMCPLCGVWLMARHVQARNFMCEFCRVQHRIVGEETVS